MSKKFKNYCKLCEKYRFCDEGSRGLACREYKPIQKGKDDNEDGKRDT